MPRTDPPFLASSLFALLCLAWGSGWLALKLGVAVMPPLAFAGSRFVGAGFVLLAWLAVRGQLGDLARLPWRALVPATLLMISVNYGLMAWGVTRVTSGVAAVVNLTTVPLAMACFAAGYGQARWTWRKGLGLAIGSGGLAVLFLPTLVHASLPAAPGAGAGPLVALGLFAIVSGAACYAWGSVLMRSRLAGAPPLALSAFQALLGGGVLMAVSAAVEPWSGLSSAAALGELAAPARLGGWIFLVAISVVSTPVYLALLARWEPSRVAAYAYICPVIAVAEGIVFGGETVSLLEASGAALLAGSAYLVLGAAHLPQGEAQANPSSLTHPQSGVSS